MSSKGSEGGHFSEPGKQASNNKNMFVQYNPHHPLFTPQENDCCG